ncbi:MAG: hypothetical protein ACLT4Y_07835 [Bifidobacterium breve]
MSGHYSLGLLFDAAQQERRCARPRTDTDIRTVARRVKKNEIVRVYRGLYAVRTYWDQLDQHERTRHIVRSLALWHPQWVFCGPTAAVMHGLRLLQAVIADLHRLPDEIARQKQRRPGAL